MSFDLLSIEMDPLNQQWGKYRIKRLIARGGMAEVFEAEIRGPAGFAKPVCLKRVRPELSSNPAFVTMFQTEARIAAMLHHVNIVEVFDFDRHGEELFLVMELVDGWDVKAIVKQAKKSGLTLPLPLVAYVADCLLAALEHAHSRERSGAQQPVIHRDVSPHNILFSKDGNVKLADFGIAKSKGISAATQVGVIKGKLAYLSPEQISGEPVTTASDLFGLGLVLVEMITGERLLKVTNDAGFVHRLQRFEFSPISGMSAPFNQLLRGLLARRPEDRFSTAKRAREALGQVPGVPFTPAQAADFVGGLMAPLGSPRRIHETRMAPTMAETAVMPPGVIQPPVSSTERPRCAGGPATTRVARRDQRLPRRPRYGKLVLGMSIATALFVGIVAVAKRDASPRAVVPVSERERARIDTDGLMEIAKVPSAGITSDNPASVASAMDAPAVTIPIIEDSETTATPPLTSVEPAVSKHRKAGSLPLPSPRAAAPLSSPEMNNTIPSAEPRQPSIPPKPGFIEVNVRPWARVMLDGRPIGTTPLQGHVSTPGRHRLVLENAPLGFREEISVEVNSGKVTSVTRTISPE